jgi:hypothetical protein
VTLKGKNTIIIIIIIIIIIFQSQLYPLACSLNSTGPIIRPSQTRKYTNTAQVFETNETQKTQNRNKL